MAASPSEYYRSASVADARSAARSKILGLLSEPISVALMHAAPPAKVPELAAHLRGLGACVTIIVVESGARGLLQQLYTSELLQAMTSRPTPKEEEERGLLGYFADKRWFDIAAPGPGFEASFPVLFLGRQGPVIDMHCLGIVPTPDVGIIRGIQYDFDDQNFGGMNLRLAMLMAGPDKIDRMAGGDGWTGWGVPM